jgi:hypothetical protein
MNSSGQREAGIAATHAPCAKLISKAATVTALALMPARANEQPA